MRLILSFILLFCFARVNAQVLNGIVKSAEDKAPLPYASIGIQNTSKGVISNENGAFTIEASGKDLVLIIRFVGYKSKKISIAELEKNPEVLLEKASVELNEVVVGSDDEYLYDLFHRVQKKLWKVPIVKSRAYLKLQTDENNTPIELIECYYNAKSSPKGIEELKLKNGRAGLFFEKDKKYLSMSTSKLFSTIALTSEQDYMPYIPFQLSQRKLKKAYDLHHLSNVGDSISVITFEPKEEENIYFSGTAWIDYKNDEIRRLELNINNAGIFALVPLSETHRLEEIRFQVTMNFQPVDGQNQLSHMNFSYDFDYVHHFRTPEIRSQRKIRSSGVLYLFEFEKPFIRPLYSYRDGYSDYAQISLLSLNSNFWNHNHGLPLTAIEQEKLAYFGQQGLLLNYQTQSDQHTRDRDSTLYNICSVVWRDSIRVKLLRDVPRGSDGGISDVLGFDNVRYNLDVQLFMDINEVEGEIQYYSASVLDLTNTYYHLEIHPFSDLFLNLYFDLAEIQRRKMEREIAQGPITVERLKKIRKKHAEALKEVHRNYIVEASQGRDIRTMARYSKQVKENLGVDNVEMLGVGLD